MCHETLSKIQIYENLDNIGKAPPDNELKSFKYFR